MLVKDVIKHFDYTTAEDKFIIRLNDGHTFYLAIQGIFKHYKDIDKLLVATNDRMMLNKNYPIKNKFEYIKMNFISMREFISIRDTLGYKNAKQILLEIAPHLYKHLKR